jgi:hypothetical protein
MIMLVLKLLTRRMLNYMAAASMIVLLLMQWAVTLAARMENARMALARIRVRIAAKMVSAIRKLRKENLVALNARKLKRHA